ncbi:MFS transporter [Taklimakanibacter deserti]|uniref:MFS transporter n=1 Tax=Taklimakanibacter deserti TaxID=2267839 RepID=UPI0013C44CB7
MTSAIETAPRMGATPIARLIAIAIISFLTLVDLFATQAILPSLAAAYHVSPGVMGSAVNLCTLGMAISGLGVALLNHRIGRRKGVVLSLTLLTIPTLLLALMPDLTLFAALRLLQGVFMSAAFSLTIAYIAETASANLISAALAAYVTGNVASNLFGRLMSAAIADHLGLPANFLIFAGLNLAGAALAFILLSDETMNRTGARQRNLLALFRRRALNASFAIGFLILFVFIGAFTYVNFVLTRPPLGLSTMQLGFVYFIFLPSIIATPFAGLASNRLGAGTVIILALLVALLGLAASLIRDLTFVLGAMTLLAAGTFFAQAAATGYVSRSAGAARGSAGGVYLASYYSGGLVGSIVIGQVFDQFGWTAVVIVLGFALSAACVIALFMTEDDSTLASQR